MIVPTCPAPCDSCTCVTITFDRKNLSCVTITFDRKNLSRAARRRSLSSRRRWRASRMGAGRRSARPPRSPPPSSLLLPLPMSLLYTPSVDDSSPSGRPRAVRIVGGSAGYSRGYGRENSRGGALFVSACLRAPPSRRVRLVRVRDAACPLSTRRGGAFVPACLLGG
jgi:hypothetical protein